MAAPKRTYGKLRAAFSGPGRQRMSAAPEIIDVGDADFYADVLERSHRTPVVVDFWAPWCGPCRQLAPTLERLADEAGGAFVLAKLNIDENPEVARQYGVQSIPLVVAFRDGQPVDQFLGLQPEPVVREFVRKLAPSEADLLVAQAEELAGSGDHETASASLNAALSLEPRHTGALLSMARLLGSRGMIEGALEMLSRVVPGDPADEAEVDRLSAELRMREHGERDEGELRTRVASEPDDLDAKLDLGRSLGARGEYEEALELLLEVVRRNADFADQGARKAMLDLFEVLGAGDPLTRRYRSALAQVLFH